MIFSSINRRRAEARQKMILSIAAHVAQLVHEKIEDEGGIAPGSALDQIGIVDGESQIQDYVYQRVEYMALDHLEYMITELDLNLADPHAGAYHDLTTNWAGTPDELELEPQRSIWRSLFAFLKT